MSAPAPDEVVDLLRALRLPHMRRAAPELLSTAKAQPWEPAEALRALLTEELTGRQRSSMRARRKAAAFPTGKTFDAWDETISPSPRPPSERCAPLSGSSGPRPSWCAGHRAPARPTSSKPSAKPLSTSVARSPGSPSKTSADSYAATPTTPSPKPCGASCASTWSSSTTSVCCPCPPTPPKRSSESSTPPTNAAPSRSPPTCTPPASTSSCPRPSPAPPSTGSCTGEQQSVEDARSPRSAACGRRMQRSVRTGSLERVGARRPRPAERHSHRHTARTAQ